MEIKIINLTKDLPLPTYANDCDAGMDVYANIYNRVVLHPGESKLIPSGIKVNIPPGYEIQVRPRSGLALKYGLTVLNSPGTIDSGYTGEIGIILINHSLNIYYVNRKDKIAQIVLSKFCKIDWNEVKDFETTGRGDNGFGSTE